jgi:hypothetical protein
MGKEIIRYGDAKGHNTSTPTARSAIITPSTRFRISLHLALEDRGHAIGAIFCCKLGLRDGKARIIKCFTKANEDPATTLEKEFLACSICNVQTPNLSCAGLNDMDISPRPSFPHFPLPPSPS